MKKVKVLFVCLGNICRSPLAEALFVHKVKMKGWKGQVEADSCGTSRYNLGEHPDPRTVEVARKNGVPIDHLARQISKEDLEDFDYIIPMDGNNYNDILRLAPGGINGKVTLMREYDPQGRGKEVPDPYYGGKSHFDEVFEMLDRSLDGFIQSLEKDMGVERGLK